MTIAATTSGRSLERIVEALTQYGMKPRQQRPEDFMALCPAHEDQRASLHINYDHGEQRTLLHCFAGCDFADVLAGIGLQVSDAFDKPLEPSERRRRDDKPRPVKRTPLPKRITSEDTPEEPEIPAKAWSETAVYSYANEAGEVVQEVIRLEATIDGRTHKRFIQRFINPRTGRWVKTKPETFVPALYSQADVLQAIAAGRPVYLVEGEKDADNGAAAGLITTTNAQGAGAFPAELAQLLAGGDVRIVVDRDKAGAKRAIDVHAMLLAADPDTRVTVLLPAVEDEKADLTDHLEAGHGADGLVEITLDDAALLAQAEEVRKSLLRRLAVAADEAIAQADDGDDTAAQRWVREAEELLLRIRAACRVDDTVKLTSTGEQLRLELASLEQQAAAQAKRARELDRAQVIPLHDEPGEGGDGGEIFDGGVNVEGVPISGPDYRVVDGRTVRVHHTKDGVRYQLIMDGWCELLEERTADDGEDAFSDPDEIAPAKPRDSYKFRFCRRQRDEDGKPIKASNGRSFAIEERTVVFDSDAVRTRSWVHSLPWPGMLASTTTKGIAEAYDAMFKARRPKPDASKLIYKQPGWRRTAFGNVFVHAGGAIGPNGHMDVPTRFDPDGRFRAYRLPEPSQDAQQLRDAWLEATVPLQQELPARIIAPLLAAVWTSVFNQTSLVTHLAGARATAKTGTASLAMQYLAPLMHGGVRRKAQLSGTDGGGTVTAFVLALGEFGHVCVLGDDFAPDSAAEKQRKKMEDIGRAYHDAAPKALGTRDGKPTRSYRPIVATLITTGEMTAGGSADTRYLNLPINGGDITDISVRYRRLESEGRIGKRALLGSSLIQYIAQHWDGLYGEWSEGRGEIPQQLNQQWQQRIGAQTSDIGLISRYSDDATVRQYGIRLMLRMLVERGAITSKEAAAFEQWAIDGLAEAYHYQDNRVGDPATQFLGALHDSIFNGTAYVSTVDGQAPDDEEIARALGWRSRISGPNVDWEPRGRERVGVLEGDRLYLMPVPAFKAARAAAAAAGEPLSETPYSVGSSFIAHGYMDSEGGKQQVRRRFEGGRKRVWDIPLDALLNAGDDDTTPDGTNEPTAPEQPDSGAQRQPEPLPEPPAEAVDEAVYEPIPEDVQPVADPAEAAPAATTTDDAHSVPTPLPAAPAKGTSFRASCAVLDERGLWLPDGELIDIGTVLGEPVRHLGSFVHLSMRLGLGAWTDGWQHSPGTIYLTREAALKLDIPVDKLPRNPDQWSPFLKEHTTDNPLVTAAVRAGWIISENDDRAFINGATSIRADGAYHVGVRLSLLDAMRDDVKSILTDDDGQRIQDWSSVARRFDKLAQHGLPFKHSASSTGLNVLKASLSAASRADVVAPSKLIEPSEFHGTEADFNWTRKPTQNEAEQRFVHAYDRSGSYLAALAGLQLGTGRPEHIENGGTYVKGAQAYYRVTVPEAPTWGAPHPFGRYAHTRIGKTSWIAAPTFELAQQLEMDLEIHEAYIWHESKRYFDKWYQTLRDARTSLDTADPDDQAARDVVKAIYTRTIGMFGSEEYLKGRDMFAPERRHAIIAKARANIYRKVQQIGQQTGIWPLAMQTDTIIYASDIEDPIAAWPGDADKDLGRGLGKYKHEASALMSEHAEYLNGGDYRGKRALGLNEE